MSPPPQPRAQVQAEVATAPMLENFFYVPPNYLGGRLATRISCNPALSVGPSASVPGKSEHRPPSSPSRGSTIFCAVKPGRRRCRRAHGHKDLAHEERAEPQPGATNPIRRRPRPIARSSRQANRPTPARAVGRIEQSQRRHLITRQPVIAAALTGRIRLREHEAHSQRPEGSRRLQRPAKASVGHLARPSCLMPGILAVEVRADAKIRQNEPRVYVGALSRTSRATLKARLYRAQAAQRGRLIPHVAGDVEGFATRPASPWVNGSFILQSDRAPRRHSGAGAKLFCAGQGPRTQSPGPWRGC